MRKVRKKVNVVRNLRGLKKSGEFHGVQIRVSHPTGYHLAIFRLTESPIDIYRQFNQLAKYFRSVAKKDFPHQNIKLWIWWRND